MNIKKVLLVVAHEGFQHIEYGEPKRLLQGAGFDVMTASNKSGPATGDDESVTDVHCTLDEVKVGDYEGIFFIGGPGAMEHLDNEKSYTIARNAVEAHVPLGAICVSTRILAKSGVLKGHQATGWDGDGELLPLYQQHGVNYVKSDVVIDDAIVTAVGPNAAEEFGREILKLLQDNKGWG